MKICFFSPYVPKHTGGGEKFFFDAAREAAALGHQVSIAIPSLVPLSADAISTMRARYQQFLDCDLSALTFVSSPLATSASWWRKVWWTRQWDVLYAVTDGSLFFSLAAKNILHIQVPYTQRLRGLSNRLKLACWTMKNTNSVFTKQVVTNAWQTPIQVVHYPMIDPPPVPGQLWQQKQKTIIHVGRFFRALHSKKQDVLVKIFRQMIQHYPKETQGWKLVLIGSIEDQEYYQEVVRLANGLPVEFLQPTRPEVWQELQKAALYWHATGFGLDPSMNPEKMEHFGISTVEAMSMGCVPLVIGYGGQPEVVGDYLATCLWTTAEDCINKTVAVINDPLRRRSLGERAMLQSKVFGRDRFVATLRTMIEEEG